MVIKNAVKLTKTRRIPLSYRVSRQKQLGQKGKKSKTSDDETLEIMREIRKRFSYR